MTWVDWLLIGALTVAVVVGFIAGALVWAVLVGFVLGWISGQVTLWGVGWRRAGRRR